MFHDGGYLGGMHGEWWILWLLVIGIALFYVWQRPSRRGDAPEYELPDDPHEVLRGRLASGAITPQQYEEPKALLDRDH